MSAPSTQDVRRNYPTVSEWSGISFDAPAHLVPRRDIRLGDLVQSSHGYKGYVAEVYTAGTGPTGGTTQITLELHRKGSGVFRSERYDATSTIPVLAFNDAAVVEDWTKLHAWSMGERDVRTQLAALSNGSLELGSPAWLAASQVVLDRVAGLLNTVDTLRDAVATLSRRNGAELD